MLLANIFLSVRLYKYKALSSYLNGQALVTNTRSFFYSKKSYYLPISVAFAAIEREILISARFAS